MSDTILFYAKSQKRTWNQLYTPYDQGYVDRDYRRSAPDGRRYRISDLTANKPGGDTSYEWRGFRPPKGRYWAYSKDKLDQFAEQGRIVQTRPDAFPQYKRYLDEMPGMPLQTIWTDIPVINNRSKEKLGYPTQKPVALLERIVQVSSNVDDIVLDAFCGCGTTLEAAAKLRRRWVGIDVSPTACRVMAQRLEDRLGLKEGVDFRVLDMPKSEGDLRRMPPFEFQNWAVIALGGIPNRVKVGDYGIDGRLYSADVVKEKRVGYDLFGDIDNWYPIQVKQKDHAGRPDIDSFETALRRDKRLRGYFVAFGFTTDAHREMRRANEHDGLDIVPITVSELLAHERVTG